MLSNHIDCLSLVSVRASLVVANSGYARRIASMNFKKFFTATRLITFVPRGYTANMLTLDRGQLTGAPLRWHPRLQAASSLNDHILTHEGLLTTWIVADLPRQRNLKKPSLVFWCKLFFTRQTNTSTRQTKTKSRKMQQSSDSRQTRRKEVTWTKQQQLEMVLAGVD